MNTETHFPKKTVRDLPLSGQTVLLRADYNVPLTKDGKISDDYRLKQSLPTLQFLLSNNCKVVICSHLGRPEGKVNKDFSLEPVAAHLSELLGQSVQFVDASIGDKVKQAAKQMKPRTVTLLENLRFHSEEEGNDPDFSAHLAKDSQAQYFVQDGFGVVHRKHASTDAVTQYLPSVAGLLLEKEYKVITGVMESPARPLLAVLGGAKVSDKIHVFERFIDIADKIIIGGAIANTFLKYRGFEIGTSKYEDNEEVLLKSIYELAAKKVGKAKVDEFLVLPTDVAVANEVSEDAKRRQVAIGEVSKTDKIVDMGQESIEKAVEAVASAGTVVWNGTLGYAELPQFAHASARLSLAIAERGNELISVVGGGDTADFVLKWAQGDTSLFTHISTGGGASLELMEGKQLPGIAALLDA